MNKRLSTETFGKWILIGEHAVVRGGPAIAFPLMARSMKLVFEPSEEPMTVQFAGPHGQELNLLFYGVLENALARLKVLQPPRGRFEIFNSLPVGAGMGASAALCGAIGRWCEAQEWIGADEVYEFSRNLEDLFHGESSGIDVAVSLSAQGVRFVRGGERRPLIPAWWPKLYLSYSGQRGITSDCVNHVKSLFATDPSRAEALDARMRDAVGMAEGALLDTGPEAFGRLRAAIEQAGSCFEEWGLTGGEVAIHQRALRDAGAVAVKPTGSGGGGYILSLWDREPPSDWAGKLLLLPRP